MSCKYKNLFGRPGEGIHAYRLFDIAIIDVLAVIIGAKIISNSYKTPFFNTLIILFIIGIIFHRLFCVKTTIDKLLFNN